MTAEIAIMNKQAVALAADSASTMSSGADKKIFPSANKLFALSRKRPVGVMVYGNASFMGIPWETLIKMYKERIGDGDFPTIDSFAEGFLGFLSNCNTFLEPSTQDRFFREVVGSFLGLIGKNCLGGIKSFVEGKGKATNKELEDIIGSQIDMAADRFKDVQTSPSVKNGFTESVVGKYGAVIDELIKVIFERLPISPEHINKLKKISTDLCCKFPKGIESRLHSGVVIAGFGEEEIFPALKSFTVEFALDGVLKFKVEKEKKISDKMMSSIVPFAQKDAVMTFMDGIDPSRALIEKGLLEQLFKESADRVVQETEGLDETQTSNLRGKLESINSEKLKEPWQKLQGLRQSKYVQPVMNIVAMLPKDELAVVAETFVDLTSFKRKVSMQSETVGGPVDVAVISKGDGFVWIKRKHYFEPELNPQFFKKY